jgi:hypothetical protein
LFVDNLGPGIYDPQASGEPYVQLNFPGRLSLLFPRGISGNALRDVLTMEWQGKSMRFQVDRKLKDLSGGCKSLELTEIRPEDAEIYLPDFPTYEILK